MGYYDGTKLLSLKDINGERPEIYISTSNRSAGKTTYFNRLVVNRFIKKKEKFILVYRYKYEISGVANKFFSELHSLFFQKYEMTEKVCGKGAFTELFLNGKSCGYAISLNAAEQIRKHSHIFAECTAMLFDEFQSEQNTYCDREVEKFKSVHVSVARGGGSQSRYLPVYMISNFVTLLNPYYSELGVIERLNNKANFIRGNGWVLEQSINSDASDALKDSAFNRAFLNNSYLTYATEKIYLNDDYQDVEKLTGKSVYVMTILYDGHDYSIREKDGRYYIKAGSDPTYTAVLNVSILTDQSKIEKLRFLFHRGMMVFDDLETKLAMIKMLRL